MSFKETGYLCVIQNTKGKYLKRTSVDNYIDLF